MSYYNTVNEKGDDLKKNKIKAQSQDEVISDFFINNPGELFTPWEIRNMVFNPPYPPITSVRRSMTTLTKKGILEKTNHKKHVGQYDRVSYSWTLNEKFRETMTILQDPMEKKTEVYIDKLLSKGPAEDRQLVIDGMPPKEGSKDLTCAICGRPLSNQKSIQLGIGPVCLSKHRPDVSKSVIHAFKGFGNCHSQVEIKIRIKDHSVYVLFVDLGIGTSVTNVSEKLAMKAKEIVGGEAVIRYFEYYKGQDRIDEIQYKWTPDGPISPTWSPCKDPFIYYLFSIDTDFCNIEK